MAERARRGVARCASGPLDDAEREYAAMRVHRGLARVAAAVLTVGVAASACTSDRNVDSPLRPVSLPDLSQMAETVQTQLRDGYMALTEVTANPAATSVELGEAYAEYGKL